MGEVLAIDDSQIGQRSEPRTSLSVMVGMKADTVSGPVMVRNLSTRGGLIEGDRLPAVGERVELRRGELLACARVIWAQPGKAGLQFVQTIKIAEWLPASHAGQQAVDKIFQQIKAETQRPPHAPVVAAPTLAVPPVELRAAAEALEALADTLAEDCDIVARHSTDLQVLDIAAQIMRRLATAG